MSALPPEVVQMLGAKLGAMPGSVASRPMNPGQLVPEDVDAAGEAVEIDEETKSELRALIVELQKADEITRRSDVRDVAERRNFWNGHHWIYWSDRDQTWKTPSFNTNLMEGESQDVPTAYYVNDYLFYGLDVCAILGSGKAPTKLFAANPNDADDIRAAEKATDYVRYFRRKNRDEFLRFKQAYFLYNDGAFYNYVRPKADRSFGVTKTPVLANVPQPFGDAMHRCPGCGAVEPVSEDMTNCGTCGTSMTPENVQPAPMVPMPVQVDEEETPNVEIALDTFGKLEVRTSPSVELVDEMPYLDLSLEISRASARAKHPEYAEKIGGGNTLGSDSTYEVNARRTIGEGTGRQSMGTLEAMVTYKRVWIQPFAFFERGKESREKLLSLFPEGVLVILCDDTVVEVRKESLTKRWRFTHAYPATGQNRPSIGSPQIPIQKAANDILNLIIDTANNSLSTTFADRETLDHDAWADTRMQAGLIYSAKARPGMALGQDFFTTPMSTVSEQTVRLYDQLSGERSQRATGVVPAVFGGVVGGAGDTSSGYRQMREQAMKRLSMPWNRMKFCNEETDLLAFDLFRELAPGDVSYVEPDDEEGQGSLHEIHVDELDGEVRVIHESTDEIPSTPMEERALLLSLMAMPNPLIQATFNEPTNAPYIKSRLATKDLKLPGEDARIRQRAEIEELLEGQPSQPLDPMTGQPAVNPISGQPITVSTVPVQMDLEDHVAHMAEIRAWWESREGQKSQKDNPGGVANVLAHYRDHEAAIQLKAMQTQQAMSVMAPPQPPPGPPPGENVKPFPQPAAAGGQ